MELPKKINIVFGIIVFILNVIVSSCVNEKPTATRPEILHKNGGVISPDALATTIGTAILRNDGNAVDAAVATSFALSVCCPESVGIGGGGVFIVRMNDGKSEVLNFLPKQFEKTIADTTKPQLNAHLQVAIPGTVDGLLKVHNKYGRLKLSDVLQPAISLAKSGFKLNRKAAKLLNISDLELMKVCTVRPEIVRDTLWEVGDILRQKMLGKTLERIRNNGREDFYKNETAQLIVDEFVRGGFNVSETELQNYESTWEKPLMRLFRDVKVFSADVNNAKINELFLLLNMISTYEKRWFAKKDVAFYHFIIEARKSVLMNDLINTKSTTWTTDWANNFDNSEPAKSYVTKKTSLAETPSAQILTTDKWGNVVCGIFTMGNKMGSKIIVGGGGFLLNASVVSNNNFAIPIFAEQNDSLRFASISSGNSAVNFSLLSLLDITDFSANLDEAFSCPQFYYSPTKDKIIIGKLSFASEYILELDRKGHRIEMSDNFGNIFGIHRWLSDGFEAQSQMSTKTSIEFIPE